MFVNLVFLDRNPDSLSPCSILRWRYTHSPHWQLRISGGWLLRLPVLASQVPSVQNTKLHAATCSLDALHDDSLLTCSHSHTSHSSCTNELVAVMWLSALYITAPHTDKRRCCTLYFLQLVYPLALVAMNFLVHFYRQCGSDTSFIIAHASQAVRVVHLTAHRPAR